MKHTVAKHVMFAPCIMVKNIAGNYCHSLFSLHSGGAVKGEKKSMTHFPHPFLREGGERAASPLLGYPLEKGAFPRASTCHDIPQCCVQVGQLLQGQHGFLVPLLYLGLPNGWASHCYVAYFIWKQKYCKRKSRQGI